MYAGRKAVRPTRRAIGVRRPYLHWRRPAPCGKVELDHCHKARPSFRTRRATTPRRRLAPFGRPVPYRAPRAPAVEAETGSVVEGPGRSCACVGDKNPKCIMPNGDCRRGL
jgi:hypothetical protein